MIFLIKIWLKKTFRTMVLLPAMVLGLIFLAGFLFLTGGCGDGTSQTIRIFAASSLQNVFRELGEDFRTTENIATKNIDLRFQFGGSSHLVRQLNEGAPGQLLASANEVVLINLEQPHTAQIFAHSELVIAVPTGNPKNITQLKDLENADLLLGTCTPDVPCGSLALQIFAQTGLSLRPDTREPSARSVLTKLELGEIDAALIYEVDVLGSSKAEAIYINEVAPAQRQNNYLISVLDTKPAPQNFRDYLFSIQAQEILVQHGFRLPK